MCKKLNLQWCLFYQQLFQSHCNKCLWGVCLYLQTMPYKISIPKTYNLTLDPLLCGNDMCHQCEMINKSKSRHITFSLPFSKLKLITYSLSYCKLSFLLNDHLPPPGRCGSPIMLTIEPTMANKCSAPCRISCIQMILFKHVSKCPIKKNDHIRRPMSVA